MYAIFTDYSRHRSLRIHLQGFLRNKKKNFSPEVHQLGMSPKQHASTVQTVLHTSSSRRLLVLDLSIWLGTKKYLLIILHWVGFFFFHVSFSICPPSADCHLCLICMALSWAILAVAWYNYATDLLLITPFDVSIMYFPMDNGCFFFKVCTSWGFQWVPLILNMENNMTFTLF